MSLFISEHPLSPPIQHHRHHPVVDMSGSVAFSLTDPHQHKVLHPFFIGGAHEYVCTQNKMNVEPDRTWQGYRFSHTQNTTRLIPRAEIFPCSTIVSLKHPDKLRLQSCYPDERLFLFYHSLRSSCFLNRNSTFLPKFNIFSLMTSWTSYRYRMALCFLAS